MLKPRVVFTIVILVNGINRILSKPSECVSAVAWLKLKFSGHVFADAFVIVTIKDAFQPFVVKSLMFMPHKIKCVMCCSVARAALP